MPIYSAILLKILPLYFNILLGYLAARLLDTNRDTIARLMFYMINPLIILNGVLNTPLDINVAFLPVIVFGISTFLCLAVYKVSKRIWDDSTTNLVAFGAGTGNTGYFGLPLALLFLDDVGEGLYIMALFGMTLYESTVGYYICVKGTLPPMDGVKKLIRLPSIHAFWFGVLINLLGFGVPPLFGEFMTHIKGAYTVLGMMIIGLGLAGIRRIQLDVPYMALSLCAKFILWPLCMFLILSLDHWLFHFFDPKMEKALMLLSIVPMAVSTVIFASLLKMHPEKAAGAVLLSTLLALIYVPLMVTIFIQS